MADEREESPERAARVERVVRDLLSGRRLGIGPGDAGERDAILAAARLAGARDPYPRMAAAFRRRLARDLKRAPEGRTLSRRTAIVAAASAAAGALGTAALGRLSGLLVPPASRPGPAYAAQPQAPGVLQPRPGKWFDAGRLAGFVEGEAVRFQAGAIGAFLVRRGDEVHAMSSICTHLPCELAWRAQRSELHCPCHNQAFDIEGASLVEADAYPLPPLPRLQVRVVDGRVEVLGA